MNIHRLHHIHVKAVGGQLFLYPGNLLHLAMGIVTEAVKLATNMKVIPGTGMWDMMKTMTLEKLTQMAGTMMPEGFMESTAPPWADWSKL